MMPDAMSTVIDTVTVLRGPSPAPGRHAAGLVFRVGQFDETLPEHGITHMVEHLTFGGHHEARYNFNASVDGRYTQFIVESGDPADIAAYLDAVCAGLAADHAATLSRERRILRTEAASRGSAGMLGTCLAERYGARGPGILNYQEFGFERLTWEQIARWRSRWFTAANAVLWVAGELPSGLRLQLPQGQRAPIPDTAQLPVTLPAYVTGAKGGIGVSLVTGRKPADTATLTVLKRRLTQALRHDHGLTYDVGVDMMDVDTSHAHAWLTADALPEQVPMAAHVLLSTAEALASGGASTAELAEYRSRTQEALQAPSAVPGLLQAQARAILAGQPARSGQERAERAAQVTTADIAKVAGRLRGSMLVAIPYEVPAVRGRMAAIAQWSPTTITGQRHQAVGGSPPTLTVSAEGVMLTVETGKNATVRYADTAALLCWNDGKRTLVGADGFTITLDPAQWAHGPSVVASVTSRIPSGLIISLDKPGPSTPKPAPAASAGGGESPKRPRSQARVQANQRIIISFLLLVLIVAGIVWGTASHSEAGFFPIVLGGIVAMRVAVSAGRRRR